jgi:hypothetical protein
MVASCNDGRTIVPPESLPSDLHSGLGRGRAQGYLAGTSAGRLPGATPPRDLLVTRPARRVGPLHGAAGGGALCAGGDGGADQRRHVRSAVWRPRCSTRRGTSRSSPSGCARRMPEAPATRSSSMLTPTWLAQRAGARAGALG